MSAMGPQATREHEVMVREAVLRAIRNDPELRVSQLSERFGCARTTIRKILLAAGYKLSRTGVVGPTEPTEVAL